MEILVIVLFIVLVLQEGLLKITDEIKFINIFLSCLFGSTVFLLTFFVPCFGLMDKTVVVATHAICYATGGYFSTLNGLVGGIFAYITLKFSAYDAENYLRKILIFVVGGGLLAVMEFLLFQLSLTYKLY